MPGKQNTRLGAIVMAVVLATATSAVADPGQPAGRPGDRCQIQPTAAQDPQPDQGKRHRGAAHGRSFSATKIVDIDFQVRFAPREHGDHLLTVEVFTPRGHLYQQIDVPFNSQLPAGTKSTKTIEGYPRPVVLQRTLEVEETGSKDKKNPRHQVTARLPVAGTLIMQNSLYGDWTAEAYLDGGDRCGTIAFEIRE